MTTHTLGKKTLAIILTLSMLVSCMVWSGVSAALADGQLLTADYETAISSYSASGGHNNNVKTGCSSLQVIGTDGAGYNGSNGYMELQHIGGSEKYNPTIRVYGNETDNAALPDNKGVAGRAYQISFYYKVTKMGGTATLGVYYDSGNDTLWSSQTSWVKTAADFVLSKSLTTTDLTGDWAYFTGTFVADAQAAFHISLIPTNKGSSNVTYTENEAGVLIDNVVISEAIVVTLDPNYEGGTAVTEAAEQNSTYTPSALTRDGYGLIGWYTDAACTAAYTGTVGDADITLYARWGKTGEIDYGFEEMPKYSDGTDYYNDTNGNSNNMNRNGHSALRRNVGEDAAYEGSYVMELKSTAAITSGHPYVGPAFRVTDMDDAAAGGYTPAKGSYVRIRFWYNVQSVTTAGKTSRLVAHSASKAWGTSSGGSNNQDAAGVTLATFTSETATNGQWVQVDTIYQITDTTVLHLGMQHDVGAAGATVWLDDLTVVTVTPVNVTMDPNYDGATAVTDLAEQNSTYTPAYVPERAGYTFGGWYTDAACTATYTGAVGEADITLYAKWVTGITLDTNGGEAMDGLTGVPGTAAVLPTPTREGYAFAGWYTDEALAVAAGEVTYPATGTVTLYAKWTHADATAWDMESEVIGSDLDVNTDYITPSTDYAKSGSRSLKLYAVSNGGTGRPQLIVKDKNGDYVSVTEGTSYLVTYWVYVPTQEGKNSSLSLNMWLQPADEATASTSKSADNVLYDSGSGSVATIPLDTWTKVTKVITSAQVGGNYLRLGLTNTAAYTSTGKMDFYVDDILVTPLDSTNTALSDERSGWLYVGGSTGKDLGAEVNSPLFTENGTTKAAIRVSATYETDAADFGTVVLGSDAYTVKQRGILLGNAETLAGTALTVDTTAAEGLLKKTEATVMNDVYWGYADNKVTYSLLIKSSKETKDMELVARAYMVVTINGTDYTLYSGMSPVFSVQSIYEAANEQWTADGNGALDWFE